jgi:hypothetical protein
MSIQRPKKASAKIPRKRVDWTPYDYSLPVAQDRIRRGDFPPSEVLAEILERNRDSPMPDWLFQHVCARLRGEVKVKRGQKPQTQWRRDFVVLANWDYRRHLAWLQRRNASIGLRGWQALQGKPWWQGPPHERALAIVHELYRRDMAEFRSVGLTRFRNLISSGR